MQIHACMHGQALVLIEHDSVSNLCVSKFSWPASCMQWCLGLKPSHFKATWWHAKIDLWSLGCPVSNSKLMSSLWLCKVPCMCSYVVPLHVLPTWQRSCMCSWGAMACATYRCFAMSHSCHLETMLFHSKPQGCAKTCIVMMHGVHVACVRSKGLHVKLAASFSMVWFHGISLHCPSPFFVPLFG